MTGDVPRTPVYMPTREPEFVGTCSICLRPININEPYVDSGLRGVTCRECEVIRLRELEETAAFRMGGFPLFVMRSTDDYVHTIAPRGTGKVTHTEKRNRDLLEASILKVFCATRKDEPPSFWQGFIEAMGKTSIDMLAEKWRTMDTRKRAWKVSSPRLDWRTRKYYRDVWGWNPQAKHNYSSTPAYRETWYEAFFPLAADPQLQGMEIGARVVFGDNPKSKNAIVFRRITRWHDCMHLNKNKKLVHNAGPDPKHVEASVSCTHTAVWSGYPGDLPANQHEFTRSTENVPVNLPPEEHFVALRSYVQGIAEMGIMNMCLATYAGGDAPFGFNSLMRSQVLGAISKISPLGADAIRRDVIGDIVDNADVEWIWERQNILNSSFNFWRILRKYKADFGDKATQLLKLKVAPKGKTSRYSADFRPAGGGRGFVIGEEIQYGDPMRVGHDTPPTYLQVEGLARQVVPDGLIEQFRNAGWFRWRQLANGTETVRPIPGAEFMWPLRNPSRLQAAIHVGAPVEFSDGLLIQVNTPEIYPRLFVTEIREGMARVRVL